MVISITTSAYMNLSIVVLPIYLQNIMGYSTAMTTLLMLPEPLPVFFILSILVIVVSIIFKPDKPINGKEYFAEKLAELSKMSLNELIVLVI